MAQAANITVNDRETTPVAHIFAPRMLESGFASFVEAGSVPIGEKNLTIRWRRNGAKFYNRIMLTVPTLVTETINGVGVPTVPRVALIDMTARFDATSTVQERANAIGMFANALASNQAVVNGTLVNLEGIW